MSRPVLCCGLLVVGLMAGLAAWAPGARTSPPPRGKSAARSLVAAAAVATDSETKGDYPAEKIRKALDQVTDLEFDKQPLTQVIEQLHKATRVPFAIDRQALPLPQDPAQEMPITASLERVKLRDGLHKMLRQYNLGYAIVDGNVLITHANVAAERQMDQVIQVNLEEVPLAQALRQLRRQTGTNVVLDRRAAKESQTPISMQLDEVPLETVVRLMAEMANLKSVRLANVLFVTTSSSAAKLRAENEPPSRAGQGLLVAPCLGGLGGLGGCFGGGALGIGGGALGIGGGGALGIAGGAPGIGGGGAGLAPAAAPARLRAARQEGATALMLALVTQEKGGDKKAEAKPKLAAPPAEAAVPMEPVSTAKRTRAVRDMVRRPITEDFPPGGTLKDALDLLQDRYKVTIVVDEQAWKDDPDLKDQFPEGIVNQPVKLPKMVGVRFATVLRLLLEPVAGDFQVRDGIVMVVLRKHVASGRFVRQPVDATFENVPLSEALAELAALSGVSIVVDGRAGEGAATPVKATIDDLPLETAVRMLADMADLTPVRLDNGLYVTTRENARVLQAEHGKRKLSIPKKEPASAGAAKTGPAPIPQAAGKQSK
ncbi:MAG TPA: hypothetical protein VG013_03760 [Gemmataceae bacterium]|nr:hypothetical protein [Gemmataceae bacterium]